MALIRELPMTRGFEIDSGSASFDAEFFVWEANGEIDVEVTVFQFAPLIYLGLVRGKITPREVGPGMWMVSVHYATINIQDAVGVDPQPAQVPAPGNAIGPEFTFDTTGATLHVTQSRKTRSKSVSFGSVGIGLPPNNAIVIDTAQAIGVSESKVEGCDIYAPKFEWSWTQPLKELPLGYMVALYQLTGTVNYAAPFFGFAAGESLYLGASGRFAFDTRWSITHRFACSPNRRNIPMGPSEVGGQGLTIPFKAGWDYMWFEYETKKVGTRMLQVPTAGYVEIVYPTGDHGIIFGGPPALLQRMPAQQWPAMKDLSKSVQQVIGTPVPPFDGEPDTGAGVPDDGAGGDW